MASLVYNGNAYLAEENESVLDCLLRQKESVRHGCRSGICQACLLKTDQNIDDRPKLFQQGLSDAQVETGLFMACQTRMESESSLACSSVDTQLVHSAKVVEKSWLNDSIIKLVLRTDSDWRAGQFVTLWRDEHVARSYSIANPQSENGEMEFHIRHYANGAFSHWLAEHLQVGEELSVQGPTGNCFYTEQTNDRPILMVAMGTGLAPIWGILKDALASPHKSPIHLIIGASESTRFYYVDDILQLLQSEERLSVSWVLPADTEGDKQSDAALQLSANTLTGYRENLRSENIYSFSEAALSELGDARVFLCGADSFVNKLRKKLFLAGANLKDIVADSFVCFSETG